MKSDKMKFIRTPNVEWRGGRSLPSVASLPARSLRWEIWRGWRNEINTWFLFRSLPLPKLGLNNSCWNAGRSWDGDVYVCVRNVLLNFSLVWSSDKNDDKKWFHVSFSNSCLGGVNDYTSDVNISYVTRKWLYLQGDKHDLERHKQMILRALVNLLDFSP